MGGELDVLRPSRRLSTPSRPQHLHRSVQGSRGTDTGHRVTQKCVSAN